MHDLTKSSNLYPSHRTEPVSLRTPLGLLLISLGLTAAVWWWLATPVMLALAPIDPSAKLDCVSYAPFRKNQTPWNSTAVIPPQQIAEDLADLSRVSRCVRTYSVENGLDAVPELASRVGLKVILGVWLGRDRIKNALLIDSAISVVEQHPDTVTAIMVGSEVLLRGEMTVADLRETIRSVKARVKTPVSYADVWEFWLRYREVAAEVDFVTAHILPYWEDFPIRAEHAAAHVIDIRQRVAVAFPDKEILIGETGWPSKGRMRDGAIPSRISQARFISGILERSRQQNFRVNFFEAYDEPWKVQWEGTVGGQWGLFDGETRALKYPPGIAIGNYPFWKLQLGSGLAFGIAVFGVAFWTLRRRQPSSPRLASWMAVAISATAGGILLGLAAEKAFYESYGFGGGLLQGFLLAIAAAVPLLAAHALMSDRALPGFVDVIGSRETTLPLPTMILGFALIAITLIATQIALTLVFDPRWRDFPFAGLTMAAVPFWTVARLNRAGAGRRPVAEAVFACLLAVAAIYVTFNEGFSNWQSLWTAVAYFLLSTTLWQVRALAVAGAKSTATIAFPEVGQLALNPIGVVLAPEPTAHVGANRSPTDT